MPDDTEPTSANLHTAAQELIAKLRARGEDAWAEKLHDAIRYGSTSGEILASLGVVLSQLLDDPASRGLKDQMTALRRQVRHL